MSSIMGLGTLSSSFAGFKSASSWFELYAAVSTFMMLLRTAINDLIPERLRSFIASKLDSLFSKTRSDNTLVSLRIERLWDGNLGDFNDLYNAVSKYLPSRITHTYKALRIGKLNSRKDLVFSVDSSQSIVDQFEGANFTWTLDEGTSNSDKDNDNSSNSETDKHAFVLTFHEKHREVAMRRYIPHVLRTYEKMNAEEACVKIFSMSHGYWNESEMSHPATLETLALDPELKRVIVDDLDRFLKRKEFYRKVGKPWKRGYLLYGPPGTGKSSLIAAIANYLKFNVYDLELNSINSNSDLMQLMRGTSTRSIIVVEDIDCNKEVHARAPRRRDYEVHSTDSELDEVEVPAEDVKDRKFTLSGLLNSMDGLWSGCGEERLVIFTTNYKEKIDAALLRPGRMDMHIHLSYLKAKAFRILASNYLDIEEHHPLLEQIEELLEKTNVTPAVVAEQLMRNEDPDVALGELSKFLKEMEKKEASRETS